MNTRSVRQYLHDMKKTLEQHPFEIFVSFMCALVGLPLVLSGAGPNSIQSLLPDPLVRLWGAEVFFGGVLTIGGLLWPHEPAERFGCTMIAAGCIVYALILFGFAGSQGTVAGSLIVSLGLAAALRAYSISRVATVHSEDFEE